MSPVEREMYKILKFKRPVRNLQIALTSWISQFRRLDGLIGSPESLCDLGIIKGDSKSFQCAGVCQTYYAES